ncbi:PREDICTED: protein spt2-like [Nelumbo nucifera]|uniref:Protein spt2-like n=1 Tax=Nelumbo nucifera TaxID=4432 RepID=A0A1U7ZRM5_NELNU|nr:PREDICTED: protein spt2-like [Nelumbo nucifera]XP_010254666.1 PREDICTED: protein spt2-like [Nelumbo nucifera]
MRGYSRAELHQRDEELDEYEEGGEDQEGEADEYEDEVEEEDPKPTKEELQYLQLRQKLKETLRKKYKKESGAVPSKTQEEKKKKLPYDNYGSFFGPSKPVIAQRVLEESKSILETRHLVSRISSSHHTNKKGSASITSGTKPSVHDKPPKIINELQRKVQKLKDTRNYSFLFSDDAELPSPAKEHPPRNVSVPSSDARSAQVPLKSKQSMNKPSRPVSNGHEERKHVSVNHKMPPKVGLQKVAPTNRPKSISADPKRQLGSNSESGPGRPVGSKGLSSKIPVPAAYKKPSVVGAKSSLPGVQKVPSLKLNSSVQKQHSEQKRDFYQPDKAKVISKQPVSSSKPQIKPPNQIPRHATMGEHCPKRKPVKRYSDEDDDDEGVQAISMIRKMFGYNPNKYAGRDEDDSDMEANFDDIQREERKSARIAKEEDERELRLIEEEERRERLRKLKKRKL